MEVLLERRVMAGLQTSKENITFSVVDLSCVTGNLSMLVYRSNPFVCWWSVTNRLVNDLNRIG